MERGPCRRLRDSVCDVLKGEVCQFCNTLSLSATYTSYIAQFIEQGGSVVEWLACWTQAQKGLGSNRCRVTVLGKLFTPVVPLFTKQQKLVTVLLRVAGVTAGLAESSGSLPPGL